MDAKQYVIDYIEGRVASEDFIKELQGNPRIAAWFDDEILSKKPIFYKITVGNDGAFHKEPKRHTIRGVMEPLGDLRATGSQLLLFPRRRHRRGN